MDDRFVGRCRGQPVAPGAAADPRPRALRRGPVRGDRRPDAPQAVPALYHLARGGNLPGEFAIVGFARRDWTDDELRDEFEKSLAKSLGPDFAEFWPAVRQPHRLRRRELRRPGGLRQAQGSGSTSSTAPTAPAATGSTTWPSPPSSSRRSSSSSARPGLIYPGAPGDALEPRRHREAVRPRPGQRPGAEPRHLAGPRREPGLPDRPLPRQGDRPEHPGAAVRQLDLRADLEPAARRVGADHRGRGAGDGRRPGRLLRQLGRAPRHGPEPPDAAPLPGGDGAAGRPLGRRRPERAGQGARRPAPAGRPRTSPATSSAASTPPGRSRGRRSPATSRRRGSSPTRRPRPTSPCG